MVKLVTFGETMGQYNAEFVGVFGDEGTYMLDCAGAESNLAVGLTKLGFTDVEAVWVSRLGDDEAGRFVIDELCGRVNVKATTHDGETTGISYLNHHSDGEHFKTYFRKGSAASRLAFSDVEPFLSGADVLHVTGITPALSDSCYEAVISSLKFANERGIAVSFDLNYREQLWSPAEAVEAFEEMIPFSDIFKLGLDEAEAIWGESGSAADYARRFQQISGGLCVVTRGMSGAVAFDGENLVGHDGFIVDVVDPVGAGDAFVAGLIGGITEHTNIPSLFRMDAKGRAQVLSYALELANVCGALTCTRHGDTAAMPTIHEVREFVESRTSRG